MENLIYVIYLGRGDADKDSLRLASSIRAFAGGLSANPIWMLTQRAEDDLSLAMRQELRDLNTRLVTIEMDEAGARFPFAAYVQVAGQAEALAEGQSRLLVMLASETLVLQPPQVFLLEAGKVLGGCPVHLKLLGSGVHEPVDDFWRAIYKYCKVGVDQIFAMTSVVDEQPIRAYFNAGLLVVRPEGGILRRWWEDFQAVYQLPEFKEIYQSSELYNIFMHQAVLAGSILATIKPGEFQLFPPGINYPLHLHDKVDTRWRPTNLNELVTCRYENFGEFFTDPDLDQKIRIDAPLKDWLNSQLEQ
ncbi:MAG: hypothetical protein C3F13_16770 [Anaerolineales bacterium]|nr:hypothetical protein [Anaerolineae bacterium]PWB50604.1 MAG: hypothetical protein C3F13_16770 [Anaerolineales bacterium]